MYVCSHIYVYLHIVCLETMAKNNEIKVNKKEKRVKKGITVLAFYFFVHSKHTYIYIFVYALL